MEVGDIVTGRTEPDDVPAKIIELLGVHGSHNWYLIEWFDEESKSIKTAKMPDYRIMPYKQDQLKLF